MVATLPRRLALRLLNEMRRQKWNVFLSYISFEMHAQLSHFLPRAIAVLCHDPCRPKHSESNTSPQRTQSRPKPVFRFSVSCFLGALVLNICISPFVDRLR